MLNDWIKDQTITTFKNVFNPFFLSNNSYRYGKASIPKKKTDRALFEDYLNTSSSGFGSSEICTSTYLD